METRFFFFFHCLTVLTVELFSIHPTKQKFPCWKLCLFPLIPLQCTSARTHLCCSPPKAPLGCCEVLLKPSLFQAGQAQFLQPHLAGRGSSPSHLCSPLLSSHHFLDLTSGRCKTGHNGYTITTEESCGLLCAVSIGLTCVFTEGALHPSVQVAEEDV